MAIDYAIQLPCVVRKQMPEAKLLAMVKYKATAEFAIEQFRQARPDADLATVVNECTVNMMVQTADGMARQMSVTIAQLLAMVAPLEQLKDACEGCPANVCGRSFGCIGLVNYPIPPDVEEWLLESLPDDQKSPRLSLLLKFVSDLDIDGAPVDANRPRKDMFEMKAPAVRKWGGWIGKKKEISSSQIIHMLAFGGEIGPQQAQLYTKLLDLTSMQSNGPSASGVKEQFKTFARAVVTAGRLNAGVHVDA